MREFGGREVDVEKEGGIGEGRIGRADDEAAEEVGTVLVRADKDVCCERM